MIDLDSGIIAKSSDLWK